MKRLEKVNILGLTYRIEYVDKPSAVDIFKRESLWGQIDYWQELHLKQWHTKEQTGHDDLDLVATALSDTLVRNNLLRDTP